MVCLDCGLVLDAPLLGAGPGPAWWSQPGPVRLRGEPPPAEPPRHETFHGPSSSAAAPLGEGEEEEERGWRGGVLDALDRLGLDGNSELAAAACGTYARIYARRPARAGFRKTGAKQRIALAFAVSNALTRGGAPRPIDDVLAACGAEGEGRRPLLNLPRYLDLGREERSRLRREDYELEEPDPADYADLVCANLGIPFHVASRVRDETRTARRRLRGRQPLVILASVILRVLAAKQGAEVEGQLCQIARCRPRSVRSALACLDSGGRP